ncbi:MAG: GAF domain-containing protein [Candidatus Promineifilaceae bacterium]
MSQSEEKKRELPMDDRLEEEVTELPERVLLQERLNRQLALLKGQITQRKAMEEALRRESALVKLLQEVAAAANTAESIAAAFQFALDKICTYTTWPIGHIYFLSANGREMVTANLYHCSHQDSLDHFRSYSQKSRFTITHDWIGQAFRLRTPYWITQIENHDNFHYGQEITALGMRSGFAFPVLIKTQVVAVLEFFSPENTEPDQELLQAMAYIGTQLGRVVERVQAAQTLQESQALLASAERLAHLGSWEWVIMHDKITWSDELYRIYGLDQNTFGASYKAFLVLVHPDDRAYVDSVIRHAIHNKQPFTYYHRIIRPDNEVRTLLAQGQPILNESGELSKLVGTGQDVTEQKKAEARLAYQAQQLTALNKMGQTVTATFNLEHIFARVLAELLPLLGADGLFILLIEGDELVFTATNEKWRGVINGQRMSAQSGVAGEVLRTGVAQAVYGSATAHSILGPMMATAGFPLQALMVAPLRIYGELIGVMEAIHHQAEGFNEGDLQVLEAAATWTAVAIDNARLFEAQQQARQTAESLRDANLKLTQSLKLNTVVETLLDHLDNLLKSDQSCVLFPEGDKLRVWMARGGWSHRENALLEMSRIPPLVEICTQKHGILISDTRAVPNWPTPLGNAQLSRSWIGIPLLAGERVLGIFVAGKKQASAFNERHRLMAEALTGQAAIAVQNARLYEEVLVSRQRLYRLNQKVISAQEDERRRVSRELHDEAGQALTALKINLNLIRYSLPAGVEGISEQLVEATDVINQTMEQIRFLAHALRPPVLDMFGLNTSLEGLCVDFARRTQLIIHYNGTVLPSLPDSAAISLYRFLQEALTNTAKHAQAREIIVTLTHTALTHRIQLTIADDGVGFDQTRFAHFAPTNSGLGLIGMQERFELLGGQVLIESQPGQGTRVTACVPIPDIQAAEKDPHSL